MPVLACPALRVMVVDDEELLRSGVAQILSVAPDLRVTAACRGGEAVDVAREQRPDVVLLDVRMPDADGLAVLRELRALPHPPQVAMLTTFDTDEYLGEALRLGAAGFLLKDTSPADLISAVRALGTGSGCLSVPMVRRLRRQGIADPAGPVLAMLSPREHEVLILLADGLTNADISARLHVSVGTVKDHVSSLLTKLHVDNRVQAAVLATRARLVTPPAPAP
ncbi:response regulator transcription factor [Streptomyces sp. NBC_00083]|uniref:response regulator n=1 Tax=Streptomyces sp. NBC_00083 TaxID=2975647 RepID=UPI002250FA01|nr:response regulator transcription factor [Streptomyces sp. NBC_00083]MCX5388138.1 response regulator transcription factor [Streptomyces sp. NBC_00083]